MKLTTLAFLFLLTVIPAIGQSYERKQDETAQSFVERLKPDSMQLAHPIIETDIWDQKHKSIIALFCRDDPKDPNTGCNKIFGHVYFPSGSNRYRDITFGPILEDGGYPEVLAIFFANADNDKEKELIVLCKLSQKHYDYEGDLYETFIYSHPEIQNELEYFEKLSEKFSGCECSFRDGRIETALYKNAQSIKSKLRKMGFK
jgi:hypothetical protein